MTPETAVWIALALNAGGVVMMLGAKRQQLSDLVKRADATDEDIDLLKRDKLAVSDYRRERDQLEHRIGDLDTRVDSRCTRIELRLDGTRR